MIERYRDCEIEYYEVEDDFIKIIVIDSVLELEACLELDYANISDEEWLLSKLDEAIDEKNAFYLKNIH